MNKKLQAKQAANLDEVLQPRRRPNVTALDNLLDRFSEPLNPESVKLNIPSIPSNDTSDDIASNTSNDTADSRAISTSDDIVDSRADSRADSTANSSVSNPVSNPVNSPVNSPANNRADSRANNTADSPVDSPASNRALSRAVSPANYTATSRANSRALSTPVSGNVTRENVQRRQSAKVKGQPLDASHTATEQKLYSVLYRLTITHGENPRRFTNIELQGLTGISSNKTVLRGLRGLCAKLSIVITNREGQNRYGIEMLVRAPSEIMQMRHQCGLRIEPVRKAIVGYTDAVRYNELLSLNMADDIADDTPDDMAESLVNNHGGITQPVMSKIHNQPPPLLLINKYGDDEQKTTDSSSQITTPFDAEKLTQVRELFTELSNGGRWKPERDEPAYAQIQHVPLWHIIVGLANSLIRCTEHRYSSLRYAVPAILEHYQTMKLFPEREMLGVAYNLMQRALNCRAAGKWTIPEWETGAPLPPDDEQA